MRRTQIYFPKSLHEDLKIAAAAANVSLSEYIRMSLKEKIYSKPIKRKGSEKGKASLLVIAENAVNLGPRDLAKNFSKYFEESLK